MLKEIESIKEKFVKNESELLELKRANQKKSKEIESKVKEIDHIKGVAETALKEVETLKKENLKQISEMKLMKEKLDELELNQTKVNAKEKDETSDEPKIDDKNKK